MDLQTSMEVTLQLGLGSFTLPCLAAVSTTSKDCHTRVQAALQAAAPAAAQQLLLQTAGDEYLKVAPQSVLKPLLERASSIANSAALERFATTLATKLIAHPNATENQARVWLSSGLKLNDAAIYAASRSPSAQPALWARCHMIMHWPPSVRDLPLSPILQALCLENPAKVSDILPRAVDGVCLYSLAGAL
jgi:hypothetical protein